MIFRCKAASLSKLACIIQQLRCVTINQSTIKQLRCIIRLQSSIIQRLRRIIFVIFVSIEDAYFCKPTVS